MSPVHTCGLLGVSLELQPSLCLVSGVWPVSAPSLGGSRALPVHRVAGKALRPEYSKRLAGCPLLREPPFKGISSLYLLQDGLSESNSKIVSGERKRHEWAEGKGQLPCGSLDNCGSGASEAHGVVLSDSPFDRPLGRSQPKKAGALGDMALGS